jgi:hypothetical protein
MKRNTIIKLAEVLDQADRDKIKTKNFALPEEQKYPIEDKRHAANALARVSQFGTPSEKVEVRKKVYEKYPMLAEHKVEKVVGKENAKEYSKGKKEELAKAAALGLLDKIKLAHKAILFRKAKLKVASHIMFDFLALPADVKEAALLNSKYLSLLKEAFSLIEDNPISEGGKLVGVFKAVKNYAPKAKGTTTIAPIIRRDSNIFSKLLKSVRSPSAYAAR